MNAMRQDVLMSLVVVASLAVATLATWLVCRWYYGRRLQAAAQRLHKSDQARQFASQQLVLARNQIQAMKGDYATAPAAAPAAAPPASQRANAPVATAARPARNAEIRQTNRDRLEAELDTDPGSASDLLPLRSGNGFADTQIMS